MNIFLKTIICNAFYKHFFQKFWKPPKIVKVNVMQIGTFYVKKICQDLGSVFHLLVMITWVIIIDTSFSLFLLMFFTIFIWLTYIFDLVWLRKKAGRLLGFYIFTKKINDQVFIVDIFCRKCKTSLSRSCWQLYGHKVKMYISTLSSTSFVNVL